MRITKEFGFEASHILPKHPGKCSRLHGHSWVLRVSVDGHINPDTGFVQDYADISVIVKPLIDRLDHHHLGQWAYTGKRLHWEIFHESDIDGTEHPWQVLGLPLDFYPTSENLLVWIGGQLQSVLAWDFLELEETCTSCASIDRNEFEALKVGA